MRTQPVVLSLAFTAALGLAQTPAFSQENRGTPEQQAACTPDVFRLCWEQIPDTNRIVGCLRQNTEQLSGPCRAVFESHASMARPQAAPRPRYSRPQPYDEPQPYYESHPYYDENTQ